MVAIPEKRIEELNRELYEIDAEQDRLKAEAIEWERKRDSIHKKIGELRLEVKGLKDKRDALNEEVKRLKSLRNEAKGRYREKILRIQDLRQRLREIKAKRPSRSAQDLEMEIKEIDWRIQTNPLPLDEEKRLVEQVRSLESQLKIQMEIKSLGDEIAGLKNDMKSLEAEISTHHEKVLNIAKQSQEAHLSVIEKLDKIRDLKAEADEMHKKYLESREKVRELHSRYKEILDQVRSLKKVIREKEEKEKAKRLSELRKKVEKEALDKLRRGEKLTFEEFKVLAEEEDA